jgi:hypothetical protein
LIYSDWIRNKSSRFFILEKKRGGKDYNMANLRERDMKNVTANVVGEVKTTSFDWDGETISVTNFSLVGKKNGKRHYTNCSAYGEWSEVAKELKAGDLVHVFGYIKERRNNDKLYKNFIVKHMNKIEKENKEEK